MTANRQTVHAPDSTKTCPNCGSDKLVRLGTQNVKMCADCPTNIDWRLKPGEPPGYGGVLDDQPDSASMKLARGSTSSKTPIDSAPLK